MPKYTPKGDAVYNLNDAEDVVALYAELLTGTLKHLQAAQDEAERLKDMREPMATLVRLVPDFIDTVRAVVIDQDTVVSREQLDEVMHRLSFAIWEAREQLQRTDPYRRKSKP